MLSTQPLRSTELAQYYSGQENYYTQGGETVQRGLWWGKGAAALGLQGAVDAQVLTTLSQGQLPSGQLLGRVQEGKHEHRPGWDLTFSAPKSVSLLALLGDRATCSIISEAVLAAAQSTLRWIEEKGSRARVTHQGNTTAVATHNLTAALFFHDLSRAADPQLHVHAVVLNMTKRPDGVWRSLASQIKGYRQNTLDPPLGFLEHVRHQQHLYGTIFRSELALRLKEQGFILQVDAAQGFFEVAGISAAAQAAYSSRAQQIQEHIGLRSQSGAKAKSVATLLTRPAKGLMDAERLHALWQEKGRAAGVDAFTEVAAVLQEVVLQKTPLPRESNACARAALERAIAQCSDRHTALRGTMLIQAAMTHTLGIASTQTILAAFEKLQTEGQLVALGASHSDRYTTPDVLAQEQQLITAAKTLQPLAPALTPAALQAFLAEHATLYPCQKAALQLLFLHPQRVQACSGAARSGKTFLIPAILKLVSLSGKRALVLNVHPSAHRSVHAACGLSNRLLSVATCLQKANRARLPAGTVLLVDNASSIPLQQIAALVELTQRSRARLILLGDTRSLAHGGSSNAFSVLLQNGLSTAGLSVPKSVSPLLPATLPALFQALLEKGRVITIPDKESRLHSMIAQYVALSPEDQKSALVVMPSLAHCHEFHSALRAALQSSGHLAQDTVELPILLPKLLHPTEKDRAECYTVGDWLRYKGQYGRITHCDSKTQTLKLQTHWGLSTRFSLKKASKRPFPLDVFTESIRALAPGDSLRSLLSQPALGLSTGERCVVIGCTAKQLILVREDGRRLRLDISRPRNRHWDYGYAVTPSSSVFPAPRCILAYQKSISRFSHARAFMNLIHRARGNVWLYTEHKDLLLQTLMQQSGAAHDLHDSLSKESIGSNPAFSAVQHSIAHLSEREAAFRPEALFGEALRHSLGMVSPEAVQEALHAAEQEGSVKTGVQGLRTTEETLRTERDILRLAKTEQHSLPALVGAVALEAYLSENTLNPEQAEALTTWTQSRDPVVVIEGYAGTQKTTLLQKAQPLLAAAGFALETLAPTHTAVKELQARGLSARTLESFLNAPYPRTTEPPVYAVDEHSMVGNQKLHRFLEFAKAQGARVLLLGDRAQYTAIEAGNPHVLLQAAEIPTATLTQIVRQKNPLLREAVDHLYKGDIPATFDCLQASIIEVGKTSPTSLDNPEKRCNRIAQDYAALSALERAQTLVLTGSNVQRTALNTAIRNQLQCQGELGEQGAQTTIWVAQDRTQTQLRDSRYYQVGQWLRRSAGEYFEITQVHASGKGLSLRTAAGETVFYLPEAEQGFVQLYQKEKREISPGDMLRWTRSDTALGLRNAEHVQVEHIENRCAWVRALAIGFEGFSPQGDAYIGFP